MGCGESRGDHIGSRSIRQVEERPALRSRVPGTGLDRMLVLSLSIESRYNEVEKARKGWVESTITGYDAIVVTGESCTNKIRSTMHNTWF